MAITQLGATNISMAGIFALSSVAPPTNISLDIMNTAFMGDSTRTGYASISASKISLWYERECEYSKGSEGGSFTAPVNPTRDRNSQFFTGWVYNGDTTPWRQTSLSDFTSAADARPHAVFTKIGTGNPATLNLSVQCSHQDRNGIPEATVITGSNVFYIWITGPSFPVGMWTATNSSGLITFNSILAGTYTSYIQDSLGAGNQFEIKYTVVYPPL